MPYGILRGALCVRVAVAGTDGIGAASVRRSDVWRKGANRKRDRQSDARVLVVNGDDGFALRTRRRVFQARLR